ncbi:hypothetical protein C6P91_24015 [Burkholderia multivorans]|nr:hypothetical protein C6P91_24015 [Burkholderia multivorans]
MGFVDEPHKHDHLEENNQSAGAGRPRDTAMRVPLLSVGALTATRSGRASRARPGGVVVMKVRVGST